MPTPEVRSGQLWLVMSTGVGLHHPRSTASTWAEQGQVILVSWVQPESESPAPWIRTVELLVNDRVLTKDLGAFNRAVRYGQLELVQDA